MSRVRNPSIIVLLMAITLFAQYSCKKDTAEQAGPPEIGVYEIRTSKIPYFMDFVGQTYGFKDIAMRARVEGFLEGVHFEEGSEVKKGDLLYSIDPLPFEAKVAEQESRLAQARTAMVKADNDLKRYKPLAAINAVSQRDLDQSVAMYEASVAEVDAAKASLRAANIELGYTRIYSPIDGLIGITQAKVGDFVGREPNPVVLNAVSSIDVILVRFSLTETQYLNIMERNIHLDDQEGKEVPARGEKLDIELHLAGGYIHPYKGKVDFADRSINASTGTLLLQASFPNPQRVVRPGQFARLRVEMEVASEGIMIPQRCITELQGKYLVNRVGDNDVIESREVTLAHKLGNMWVVTGGLSAGDKIVLEGLQVVREGVKILPVVTEFEMIGGGA